MLQTKGCGASSAEILLRKTTTYLPTLPYVFALEGGYSLQALGEFEFLRYVKVSDEKLPAEHDICPPTRE